MRPIPLGIDTATGDFMTGCAAAGPFEWMRTIFGPLLAFGLVAACGAKTNLDTPTGTGNLGDDGTSANGSVGADGGTGSTGCVGPGHYELVETNDFASPLPDANGIAFDGANLWILSGTISEVNDPSTSTVIRMNPSTLAVDRTLTLSIPDTAAQGTVVRGLAWDGEALWVTSGEVESGALHRVDPTTGQVTRTMSSPTYGDLAFDGTALWLESAGNADTYRIDPTTGAALAHFVAGGPSLRGIGIAVRTCEVWVGELLDNGLQVFDSDNGMLVASAVGADGNPFSATGPSVFVNGQLVVLSQLGISYYDVTPKP